MIKVSIIIIIFALVGIYSVLTDIEEELNLTRTNNYNQLNSIESMQEQIYNCFFYKSRC